MARFTLPRDLYHGKGALEALKTLKGTRAMVCVGGGSMKRFGFLDKVVSYLKEAGMEVELFEGIEPDPSVTTVMKGAEAMAKFQPDWIVAIGGGSPIDAAKAMLCPFCGITYDYEYFREDNVLDLATRALNRCEFGSAKEAFEFALKKDPHSTKALRGIILCNNQWKNMAPLLYVEKVYLKKDDPSLLKAIENCEPENKEYFENIKNALSILDEFRWMIN